MATLVLVAACGTQEEPKPRPLPEDPKALRPGTYHSEEFEPSFSLRVGEGWTYVPPETSDVLRFTRGETGGLGFANVQEVYKPTRTGVPPVEKAPEDMVGWFRQHPYLQTSKPKPVTVGGVEGERFDLIVGNLPQDYLGVCGRDCVATLRFSDGTRLGIYPKDKQRLIVLEDVEGETVIMGFASTTSGFDAFAPTAQEVIDTVDWRGE